MERTDMSTPVVFFDIAGPDLQKQASFYGKVFGWSIGPDPHFPEQASTIRPVPVVSPLPGTLRKDPGGMMIYLGVADIEATLEKIAAHGGTPASPRMEVPGVVVLAIFTDPAGNRMGLVEMDGDRRRIP
jgi:predicted enzyme related to lactoylglutathione lyase